jgi:hypothetical protein
MWTVLTLSLLQTEQHAVQYEQNSSATNGTFLIYCKVAVFKWCVRARHCMKFQILTTQWLTAAAQAADTIFANSERVNKAYINLKLLIHDDYWHMYY